MRNPTIKFTVDSCEVNGHTGYRPHLEAQPGKAADSTHTLEILESGSSYMTLKMPTEVASYNMPTVGNFTFKLHGGVAGSAVQTVTKNNISIAF